MYLLIYLLSVCVCMCTWKYTHTHTHTHTHTLAYVKARGQGLVPLSPATLFFETRFLADPGAHRSPDGMTMDPLEYLARCVGIIGADCYPDFVCGC
jgi:hypothetical protein